MFGAVSTTIVVPGLDDHPADDWYTNSKSIYPGTRDYHFMFPARYNHVTESSDMHLFASPDGIIWNRIPGDPILQPGPPGSWDGGCVFGGNGLIPLKGDKIALPYGGYIYPHKYPRNTATFKTSTAYALWERERICVMDIPEKGAFSISRSFRQEAN